MSLLNDELNAPVLECGTQMGPILRLVVRQATEIASRCISDVDEVVLPVRQRGIVGSHIGTGVVETEDMI